MVVDQEREENNLHLIYKDIGLAADNIKKIQFL